MQGSVDIGKRLIDAGADINKANNYGATPLMFAISSGSRDFIILLLESEDIDVNAVSVIGPGQRGGLLGDRGGNTALLTAVLDTAYNEDREPDIVEMLLKSGADPNVVNGSGITALHVAAVRRLDVVQILVDNGADINRKDGLGFTILMRAVSGASYPIVDVLLTLPQLDLDITNNVGRTALMMAANIRFGGASLVAKLLAAGADPLIVSKEGRSALDYADNEQSSQLLADARAVWRKAERQANTDLKQKFMVARRLRQGIETTEGARLELPSRDLTEGLIRKAEYDNLCMGLQTNLNKPGVIALAKSLKIKTTGQTKNQLCQTIAERLTIK